MDASDFPTPIAHILAGRVQRDIHWAIDEYEISAAEIVAALAPFVSAYAMDAAMDYELDEEED